MTRVRYKCPVPGCPVQVNVRLDAFPVHCACGFTQRHPEIGLGDRIAALLHFAGATKVRYMHAKRLLGLRPECDCDKRREALNRLGRRATTEAQKTQDRQG